MNIKEYFNVENIKGQCQKVVALETAEVLQLFCNQEPEFEQAIKQSGKTFQECLDSIVKGITTGLSDLKAYKRAVQFYFSTADIHFNMTIDLSGNNGYEAPPITVSHTDQAEPKEKKISLSIDDILDF